MRLLVTERIHIIALVDLKYTDVTAVLLPGESKKRKEDQSPLPVACLKSL
jgi:hypothetical protein